MSCFVVLTFTWFGIFIVNDCGKRCGSCRSLCDMKTRDSRIRSACARMSAAFSVARTVATLSPMMAISMLSITSCTKTMKTTKTVTLSAVGSGVKSSTLKLPIIMLKEDSTAMAGLLYRVETSLSMVSMCWRFMNAKAKPMRIMASTNKYGATSIQTVLTATARLRQRLRFEGRLGQPLLHLLCLMIGTATAVRSKPRM